MKVLKLKLGDKTYTTGKITAHMSREALKIQKDAMELGKKGTKMQKLDSEDSQNKMTDEELINMAGELIVSTEELTDRKEQLIIDVYGGKFDIDELENNLSNQEIDQEINNILNGITGIVQKATKN
jgi:hypothetical protein